MSSNANIALNQIGYQQLTVTGTPVGLTLPTMTLGGTQVSTTPEHVIITIVGQPVRWRADGTNPAGAFGTPQAAGTVINWLDPFTNFYAVIKNMKFIRDSASTGNATLEIAYFQ